MTSLEFGSVISCTSRTKVGGPVWRDPKRKKMKFYKFLFLPGIIGCLAVIGIVTHQIHRNYETIQINSGKICDNNFNPRRNTAESLVNENGTAKSMAILTQPFTDKPRSEMVVAVLLIVFSIVLPFVPIVAKLPSKWSMNKAQTTVMHLIGQSSSASLSEALKSLIVMPDLTFLSRCNLSPSECHSMLKEFSEGQIFRIVRSAEANITLSGKPETANINGTSGELPVLCPDSSSSLDEINESLHGLPDIVSTMTGAGVAMFICNVASWTYAKYRFEFSQPAAEPQEELNYWLPRPISNVLVALNFILFVCVFVYYQFTQSTFDFSITCSSFFFGFIMQMLITAMFYMHNVEKKEIAQ